MPKVTFLHPEGKSGEVTRGQSLLEAAEALGFPLNHDCGGNASCTTCRVEVQVGEENLSEIDFDEQDLLDREALSERWHRLGCQSRVLGDVIVRVPEQKWEAPGSMDQEKVEQLQRTLAELGKPRSLKENSMVTITPMAEQKIKELMQEEKDTVGLRVYVRGGGCHGYQYGMAFETKIGEDDSIIEKGDVKVIMDSQSAPLLSGAEVDYVDSLQGSGFAIKNPQAKTTCGCGSSFSA